jgi:hypothetical protein
MQSVYINDSAVLAVVAICLNVCVNKSSHPILNPLLLVTEPRTRDNINMDLRKVGCLERRQLQLPQDRFRCRDLVLAVFT